MNKTTTMLSKLSPSALLLRKQWGHKDGPAFVKLCKNRGNLLVINALAEVLAQARQEKFLAHF